MKSMLRNSLGILMMAAVPAFLLSCGAATEGFNAPIGTTVTAPASFTADIPAGAGGWLVLTFSVQAPNSMDQLEGLNGVQVVMFSGGLDMYDTDPAGHALTADTSELVSVGTHYVTKTNDQGLITVGVLLQSPADFGLKTLKFDVTASVGVASAKATVTLTDPA